MTSTGLKYFFYISPAKVVQLHDQLHPHQVVSRSQKTGGEIGGSLGAGVSAIFNLFRGEAKLEGRRHVSVDEQTTKSIIHKLREVTTHIEANKHVEDLFELCGRDEHAPLPLTAFAYTYCGCFSGSGYLHPREAFVRDPKSKEKLTSQDFDEDLLLGPAREENSFRILGERVGDPHIWILSSIIRNGYFLELACSAKNFTIPDDNSKWRSNLFCMTQTDQIWLEGLMFVMGVKNRVIMGTPLFLVLAPGPTAQRSDFMAGGLR